MHFPSLLSISLSFWYLSSTTQAQGCNFRKRSLSNHLQGAPQPAAELSEHVRRYEPGLAQAGGLARRASCNSDNLLRAFQHTPSATPFCSSLISKPTPTVVVPGPVYKKPVVVTVTFTTTVSVYPDGRPNLAVNYPTFLPLTSTSLSRIVSACSCLITPATTTVTATSSTVLVISTVTTTTTLTGACATPPFAGAFIIGTEPDEAPIGVEIDDVGFLAPYSCCELCLYEPSVYSNCIAWIAGTGDGDCLISYYPDTNPQCASGKTDGEVGVDPVADINGLGGPGPCSSEVYECNPNIGLVSVVPKY